MGMRARPCDHPEITSLSVSKCPEEEEARDRDLPDLPVNTRHGARLHASISVILQRYKLVWAWQVSTVEAEMEVCDGGKTDADMTDFNLCNITEIEVHGKQMSNQLSLGSSDYDFNLCNITEV